MSLVNEGITIIVPVYNSEKFVGKCIESVLKQTYHDWQLLLVDDGSQDYAGAICEKYAESDSRIKVIHQINGGPGKARNNGINHCYTRWFTFLDSDDVIEPDFLENYHVEQLFDDTQLSIQGFKRIDMNGNALDEVYELENTIFRGAGEIVKSFVDNDVFMYGQSCGKLYNKVIVDKYNITLSTELKLSEDHLFYLQYLLHVSEIHTHAGTKYCYQMADAELSLTHRVIPWKESLKRFHVLYDATEDIVHKYNVSDRRLLRIIYYFSVTGGISLTLNSLYKTEQNAKIRCNVLLMLTKDLKKCRNKYYAHGLKGKVMKYIMLYLPVFVQDMLLKKFIY